MVSLQIRTSKNMRHMRHFGRQSTRISSHVAHSAVHNSVKGNNAHNETKLSKDIVTSSMISEMDHGTSEKDLSANQSVHFKEQHRNCILTTQRDGVSTLCISENIDRNTQVRSNSKKPRRRIDRSISTTNTRNQTYTKHVSSTTKCHGPKKVIFHLNFISSSISMRPEIKTNWIIISKYILLNNSIQTMSDKSETIRKKTAKGINPSMVRKNSPKSLNVKFLRSWATTTLV